jgi:c-di-GMP-binding flagellar brake protein YcgR
MPEAYLDRRRDPRVPMGGDQQVGLPMALTVRLVDISAGGVLLSSSQKLNVGQRARLRTSLGADPFNVEIEVRRVAEGGGDGNGRGRYRVGAVFTALDEAANRSVSHFLSGEVQ